MSNPFYNYSGNIIPGTLGRAESVSSEFTSVQTGFSLLVIKGTDTGSPTAYVVTTSGQPTVAYADGNEILFKATNTNTGSATVNVNGIGAVSIFRFNGGALQAGDLVAGTYYTMIYNSTYGGFTIIGPAAIVTSSSTISASPPIHLVGVGPAAGGVSTAVAPIDATWALDLTISPTWTGSHIFNGAISGAALTNYLASPAAIGGTAPAAGEFTNLTATGTFVSKLIQDNGNVTLAAPASGVGLTVTGFAGSYAAVFNSANSGTKNGVQINAGSAPTDSAFVVNNQAQTHTFFQVYGDGHAALGFNGTVSTLTLSAAGLVTIAAPASGSAMVINVLDDTVGMSFVNSGNTDGFNISVYENTSTLIGFVGSGPATFTGAAHNDFGIAAVTGKLRLGYGAGAATALTIDQTGGLQVGSPTGGSEGAGTINVSGGYYVNGALSTAITGSFTGTLNGCTTSPTVTITYTIIGSQITFYIPAITATSNATTMTITGTFGGFSGATKTVPVVGLEDNSHAGLLGNCQVSTSGGTVTFSFNVSSTTALSPYVEFGAWTNSGAKGIGANTVVTITTD